MEQRAPELPPVRYATTPDGVSLAYLIGGSGSSVVVMPFHHAHCALRWSTGDDWAPGLARRHRVVSYDSRGQGLSERRLAEDPTLAAYRLDQRSAQ